MVWRGCAGLCTGPHLPNAQLRHMLLLVRLTRLLPHSQQHAHAVFLSCGMCHLQRPVLVTMARWWCATPVAAACALLRELERVQAPQPASLGSA